MAARKICTKVETMKLSLYGSIYGITKTQFIKTIKETTWLSIGDALNTTSDEVKRKTHNSSKSI
jgi:hypothetical protein